STWYVANRYIGGFLEAFGFVLDTAVETLNQGLLMTQPLRCDPSGLPELSRDRGIKLYPSEPIDSQRYRLPQWLNLHRQRGTHQAERRPARRSFPTSSALPLMRMVHKEGKGVIATWHPLDAEGVYTVQQHQPSNWDYDGHVEMWSRFWFILYPPAFFLDQKYW